MKLKAVLFQYQIHQILQPKTISNYKGAVYSLEKFADKELDLNELTIDLLLRYRQKVLGKCSAITFNHYRRHLSVLINFAIKQEWMSKNLFADVKAAPVPKRKPKTVPIKFLQEIIDFLAKSGDKYDDAERMFVSLGPRWFWLIVVKTFYYSAIRRRQITEIRLKDVDFENQLFRLRSEGSKTKREWDIPIPDELLPDLKYLSAKIIEITGRYDENQQLFCYPLLATRPESFKSKELTVEHISSWFKRLSRLLDRRISPHRIRHTTATELTRNTENIRLVQEILGHTDLRTTFIYVEPEMGSMRKLMGGMTKLANVL